MPAESPTLRVAIVAGVNPGKWTSAWAERRRDTPIEVCVVAEADQRQVLIENRADIAFLRLPVDRDGLSVIRLYEEAPVVVASRDHPLSLFDAVSRADLKDETVRTEQLDDAIDLVVADAGILLLPQSVARQFSRRDLVVRPITDAPATEIAIAWLSEGTTPDIEEFVGIVRGRTAASSRGAQPERRQKGKQPTPRQKSKQPPPRRR